MDDTIDDDFILIDHPCRPPTTSATSTTPSYLPTISTHINTLSPKLRDISLTIHDNPELNYEEFTAYALLVGFFEGLGGWKVEEKACGIETAFIAVFENGGREEGKEGINALPGIGHACGHNLIAIASISAALATKHVMEKFDIPGKVVLFGTPAEEGTSDFVDSIGCSKLGRATEAAITPSISHIPRELSGAVAIHKVEKLRASLGGDTLLTSQHISIYTQHSGGGKIALLNAGAYAKHNVDISLISHPGITPDASLVRTSAFQAFRIEYFGLEAHAAAAPWEGINALDALITAYTSISVLRQQTQSGDIIQGCITQGGVKPNIIHAYASGDFVASTDQGDISHAMPSISAGFRIESVARDGGQGGGPHTPDFTRASRTEKAHEKALMVGKALAATAVDVLTVEGYLEEIKKEFKRGREQIAEVNGLREATSSSKLYASPI
ncbi:MAG: Uncharacterized protein AUREO_053070 [Aureobasidium pullulans]|nr:MAG: Uncharacterized protein AUREO_053070 [Aureobasidium pullulans]